MFEKKLKTKVSKMLLSFWNEIKIAKFWATITATMIGVFAAFYLNECRHSVFIKEKINAKLYMTFLESKQNALVAIQAQDLYSETDQSTPMRRPITQAAENALSDPDLLRVLSYEDVNLLRLYIYRMTVFNRTLDSIHELRMNAGSSSFSVPKTFMDLYRNNVASAAAYIKVVQEQLEKYYKKFGMKDEGKYKAIDDRIENYKKKALSGKLKQQEE